MTDDFERLLSDSLDERADRLERRGYRGGRGIDGVYHRAERRRVRRRAVAGVGSVALVGIGVLGIAAVDQGDAPAPAAPPVSDSSPDGVDPVSGRVYLAEGHPLWQCAQQVDEWGPNGELYFAECEPATLDRVVMVMEPPSFTTVPEYGAECWTTVPAEPPDSVDVTVACPVTPETAPPTTAPPLLPTTTTVGCEVTTGEGVPVSVPCSTLPPLPADVEPMTEVCEDESQVTVPCTTGPALAEFEQSYTILPGDSMTAIAGWFGITVEQLVNYNAWPEGLDHLLLPGDTILIPPGAVVPES